MGFNELQREVQKISDKVLFDSLQDLQERDIVSKEVISEKPKEVEYSLTEEGRSLEPVIQAMEDWGQENASVL